jgi:beta-glucosidase
MAFPNDFVWGAASASYQIEGATREDDRGESVWDMFCRQPGMVFHGHTGDVACDHYHRYREDVALMKQLGVKAYELSLAWPRILPDGTGAVSSKGVDFYRRLLDELLSAGIQPWVKLFHWDYPLALFHRGGWLNPDSPRWFADYARVAVEALGDRVSVWLTMNEPQCFIGLGLRDGEHAPGLKLPQREAVQAAHHTLLAHGLAVLAIRAGIKRPAPVGLAPCGLVKVPATNDPKDIAAARTAFFSAEPLLHSVTWWLDPIYKGEYPTDGLAMLGADAPRVAAGDMKTICQPLDFCGINIYSAKCVRAGRDGKPEVLLPPPGYNRTSQNNWHVNPPAMYWAPKFLHERYGLPVVITENGHQNLDAPALDGKVHDPQRIDYLHRYLLELGRAIGDGVPVKGYFCWTLTDNFEWALGYNVRVGLVYTDFQTQQRIPKDSFTWYRRVIATNGASLRPPRSGSSV